MNIVRMPFRLRVGKKSGRYDLAKDVSVISIGLLELDGDATQYTFDSLASGRDCLDYVCQKLELKQSIYFGLRFKDRQKADRWVDLGRPLRRQLEKSALEFRLQFGIMFYLTDAQQLVDSVARHYFYVLVREDILYGRLLVNPDSAVEMACFILQADFGSCDTSSLNADDLVSYPLFPKHMIKGTQVLSDMIKAALARLPLVRGMAPGTAEQEYIRLARNADMYGQGYFQGRDETGSKLSVGYEPDGIVVRHVTSDFWKCSWKDIVLISAQKRRLVIHLDGWNVKYVMSDVDAAKYAAHVCSLQMLFYREYENGIGGRQSMLNNRSTYQASGTWKPKITEFSRLVGPADIATLECNTTVGNPTKSMSTTKRLSLSTNYLAVSPSSNFQAFTNSSGHIPDFSKQESTSPALNHYQPPLQEYRRIVSVSVQNLNCAMISPLCHDRVSPPTSYPSPPPAYRPSPNYKSALSRPSLDEYVYAHYQQLGSLEVQHGQTDPDSGDHRADLACRDVVDTGVLTLAAGRQHAVVGHPSEFPAVLQQPPMHTYSNPEIHSSSTAYHSSVDDYASVMIVAPEQVGGFLCESRMDQVTNRATSEAGSPALAFPRNQPAHTPPLSESQASSSPIPYRSPPTYSSRVCTSSPDLSSTHAVFKSTSSPDLLPFISGDNFAAAAHHPWLTPPPAAYCNHNNASQASNQLNSRILINYESQVPLDITMENLSIDPVLFRTGRFGEMNEGRDFMNISAKGPSINYKVSPSISYSTYETEEGSDIPRDHSGSTVNSMYTDSSGLIGEFQRFNPREAIVRTSLLSIANSEVETVARESFADDALIESRYAVVQADRDREDGAGDRQDETPSTDHQKTAVMETKEFCPTSSSSSFGEAHWDAMTKDGTARSRDSPVGNTPLRENPCSGGYLVDGKNQERVKQMQQKLGVSEQLSQEYENIPRKRFSAGLSTAQRSMNAPRNRYPLILPYEDTRVQLRSTKANASGYINASHVMMRLHSEIVSYIATQGPLHQTSADLWQMVWEYSVDVVVMLTKVKEPTTGEELCYQYWPSQDKKKKSAEKLRFGDFQVTLLFASPASHAHVTSQLALKHVPSGLKRNLYHIQYLDWDEIGLPSSDESFLEFLDEVKSVRQHVENESRLTASLHDHTRPLHFSSSTAGSGLSVKSPLSASGSHPCDSHHRRDVSEASLTNSGASSSASGGGKRRNSAHSILSVRNGDVAESINQSTRSTGSNRSSGSESLPRSKRDRSISSLMSPGGLAGLLQSAVKPSSNSHLASSAASKSNGHLLISEPAIPPSVRELDRINSRPAIIVHCNDGIGRTGAYILTDMMIQCIEHNQDVDVPRCLSSLRQQRMHMVQTLGQYQFVYSCLVKYMSQSRLI